ncbi:MAG: hypothetical protein LBG80_14805 [Bacteroidales bacterium]|jgi:hypothetical protein|nr:hypothetical protein [Bacteroidales bacterium]
MNHINQVNRHLSKKEESRTNQNTGNNWKNIIKFQLLNFGCRTVIFLSLQFFAIVAYGNCDFEMVVTTEPATCQNDGQIKVTVTGADSAFLDLVNAEYAIQAVNTTFQTSFARWTNGTFSEVPPGTYVIKMRVYCSLSGRWETRTSATNVFVGGNYEPIEYVSATVRRHALPCATRTGQMNFTIDGGRAPYIVRFLTKPAAFDKDSIILNISSGSTVLIDSLPAGTYDITVTDACDYTFDPDPTSNTFTINTLAYNIPNATLFYPYTLNPTGSGSCNQVTYSVGYISGDYSPYWNSYRNQFYEISFIVNGQQTPWQNAGSTVTLPYTYKTIRDNKYEITYELRLKPSIVDNPPCVSPPTSQMSSMPLNTVNLSSFFYDAGICHLARVYFSLSHLCYPYTWEFTPLGNLYDTVASGTANGNGYQYPTVQFTRGVTYRLSATDAEGYKFATNITVPTPPGQSFTSYSYSVSGATYGYPYFNPSSPLGSSYMYMYVYPNNGFPITPGTTIEYVSGPANAMLDPFFGGIGSIYTIPVGYNSSNFYPWSDNQGGNGTNKYISPGSYMFRITNTCGTISEFTYNRGSIFAQKQDDFTYTTQESCNGITIYPVGHINLLNEDGSISQQDAAFSISGPNNYYCSSGRSVTLNRKGNYTISMGHSSSYTGWFPKTFTYGKTNVVLDPDYNMAYSCTDTGIAYLKIQAKNGVPPYTYEIWGSNLPPNQTGEFRYGYGGEMHLLRVSDACGKASFIIPLSILNLRNAAIAYAYNNGVVCEGGEIGINCVNLGENATYQWTGPNGFTSNERMPRISPATMNMAGWYKIEVTPEFCPDSTFIDSVEITIIPQVSAPNVTNDTVVICHTYNGTPQSITSFFDITSTSNAPLRWYDQWGVYIPRPEGTMIDQYQTGTHTYFISYGYPGSCESPRLRLTLIIQQSTGLALKSIAAYVCQGDNVATVKAQASNGIPPYTYEIVGSNLSNQSGEFTYGQAGKTYQMKVTDYCSNSVTLPFTVVSDSLFTEDTIYGCMDAYAVVSCPDLGNVTYEWTGPNDFVANTRQFVIYNVTNSNTGWYKVRVTPEGCTNEITDSVYLVLVHESSIPTVANDTLYYCSYHYEENKIVYDTLHIQTDAGITGCCPLRWYDNITTNTLLSYDIDNLPATNIGYSTKTFYVSQGYAAACESDRVPITVIFRTGYHEMDKDKSYAYSCAGLAAANIHIEAKNEAPPYTYEIPGSGLPPNTTGDFIYGEAGKTYPVTIYNACGIAINDFITVTPIISGAVTEPKIWYYCDGDNIYLKTINVGDEASYSWTGPNNFTSADKNPIISNASSIHEGIYRLSMTLAGCSGVITDSVEAVMISNPVAPVVANPTVTLCIIEGVISLEDVAGVSAPYALHWYNSPTSMVEVSPIINIANFSNNTVLTFYVSQGASDLNGCQSNRVQITITVKGHHIENTTFEKNQFVYCPDEIPEPVGSSKKPYIYKFDNSGIDTTAVFNYQWQYYNGEFPVDGNQAIEALWEDIPGATSDSLFFTQPLTQSTWFRRKVTTDGPYSCGTNIIPGYWIWMNEDKIHIIISAPPEDVDLDFGIQPNAEGIVFVKDYDGHGWNVPVNADGSSWAKAYPGLADPLLLAHYERCDDNIKEIRVAAGTYYPEYIINEEDVVSDGEQTFSVVMTDRNKSFVLVRGVKVYGGFPANATDGVDFIDHLSGTDTRDLTDPANTTILSGDIGVPNNMADNVYHVIVSANIPSYEIETSTHRNATLDGFTIAFGNANSNSGSNNNTINGIMIESGSGAGIYNGYAYPVLKNLSVTENITNGSGGGIYLYGNGASVYDPFFTLTNVSVTKNNSNYGGGGIYAYSANVTLQNCNISENTSSNYGGGIYSYNSIMKLTNVIVSKNRVTSSSNNNAYGGGIYSSSGRLNMLNVRITNNEAITGGGLYIASSSNNFPDPYKSAYEMTNVTVADNTATTSAGGMFASTYIPTNSSENEARGRITNTIFWNNLVDGEKNDIYQNTAVVPFISYSIVNGCFHGEYCGGVNPIGINGGKNKTVDPQFNDPANDDYTLTECSPAVNAGNNADPLLAGVLYDLGGNQRIVNEKIDMGAYEYGNASSINDSILYVDHTATGNNDGSSWTNAFISFADAVKKTSCGGGVSYILVAEGTYHPEYDEEYNTYPSSSASGATRRAFVFTSIFNGVKVLGGYANGLSDDSSPEQNYYITSYQRDPLTHESILSGDFDDNDGVDADGLPVVNGRNAVHVLITVNADTTLLFDGLTVTGGNAAFSEAICQIEGNYINNYSGAGVYNSESSPSFNNVIITRNKANSSGGGVYNTSLVLTDNLLMPIFTHSSISYNKAFNGGGVYNEYSRAVYKNTRICYNQSENAGAGVFNGGASAIFINVIIDHNKAGGSLADEGSAITNDKKSASVNITPSFVNNTIVDNASASSTSTGGNAIYNISGVQAKVNNTILWNNGSSPVSSNSGSAITYITSLVEGANTGGYDGTDPAYTPLFNPDYSLQLAGFGIDKGTNNAYTSIPFTDTADVDFAGMPRMGDIIDLGAFEQTIVITLNDTVHVFKNSSNNEIDTVLDNDIFSCQYPLIVLWKSPEKGTADMTNNIITYDPDAGFAGHDSLAYIVSCGTMSDTAWLHIFVEDMYIESNAICVGANTTLYPSTNVTWVSAYPTVASVTNDGIVTGLSQGTTYFIATNTEGFSVFSPPISVAECLVVSISCDDMPYHINVLDYVTLPNNCGTPSIFLITQPTNGTTGISGMDVIYYGTTSGTDSLAFRVVCGAFVSDIKLNIYVDASGSAFVDDVWYFGMNAQGLRFVNNGSSYSAVDASGKSKVNSHENSLVVSSPYCDGQTIFYSSHNHLYNSLHEPMSNGHFMGHQSVADGLAACYMGNNKYMFFSVTDAYSPDANTRGLKAYIIDMNEDHGKGKIIDSLVIENASSDMSESIELIAANETHQYWLIYAYKTGGHHKLRVRPVDLNASLPIGNIIDSIQTSTNSGNHTYTLKASPQHNRIAIANSDNKTADVFDFDNITGKLSNQRITPSTYPIRGIAYGVEFSPDGNQLYVAGYTTTGPDIPVICQYEITNTNLVFRDSIVYWTYSGSDGHARGGGLKLGPDSNIYVILSYDVHVGVVSSPNSITPLRDNRYTTMALNYNPSSFALQFSTGLTKPSIMECNTNSAPITQLDSVSLCVHPISRTATVNVLRNDHDVTNDNIFLTSANFVYETDTLLATLTVNAADSTVTVTLKSDANPSANHVFEIIYQVKDDGLPASQCASGLLKLKVTPVVAASDITVNDTTICFGTTATLIATTSTIPNPVYNWYTSQTETTPFHTGETYTTSNLTVDSIFYLGVYGDNYCENDTGNRKAVTISTYPLLDGGKIGPSQTYCYNVMPLISLGITPASGGSGAINYTYQWKSSTDGITFSAAGLPAAQQYGINTQLSQTTYYYRLVTDAVCGEVSSDTIQITINPLPLVDVGLKTICIGLRTPLIPDTGGIWTVDRSDIVEIINDSIIEGKSAGTATLTYTSSTTGCSEDVIVTVNPYPVPDETTGDKVICIGQTVQLSNAIPDGVWTHNNDNIRLDNPIVNPAPATVEVTGLKVGKSYITYTVSSGICQTKRTFLLKVISNTPPKVFIGIER